MREFKIKAGPDIGELASKHFAGVTVQVRLVDKGATDDETVANILRSAGSASNARAIFVSGGEALARQKAVKALATKLAPRVESAARVAAGEEPFKTGETVHEPLDRDAAVQQLVDLAAAETAPEVTVRGEGTGKPRSQTAKKAVAGERQRLRDQALANLANMPEDQRAQAEQLLRLMSPDLFADEAADGEEQGEPAAAEAAPAQAGGRRNRR